jgi:hypothetical protein
MLDGRSASDNCAMAETVGPLRAAAALTALLALAVVADRWRGATHRMLLPRGRVRVVRLASR